jgi:hypothetical protein
VAEAIAWAAWAEAAQWEADSKWVLHSEFLAVFLEKIRSFLEQILHQESIEVFLKVFLEGQAFEAVQAFLELSLATLVPLASLHYKEYNILNIFIDH